VQKLIDVYRPLKIYLFGSRAKGEAEFDSDYDIMLVVPDDSPSCLKSATKAYEIMWGASVPVDILIRTESNFNIRLDIENSLPSTVEREGRILYSL